MTKEEKLQLKELLQKLVIEYDSKITQLLYAAIVAIYTLIEEE